MIAARRAAGATVLALSLLAVPGPASAQTGPDGTIAFASTQTAITTSTPWPPTGRGW